MTTHVEKQVSGDYKQGTAQVVRTGDDVTVTLEDKVYRNVEVSEGVFLPDDFKDGEYSIRLSGDGTKLYSIRPVQGKFVLQFDRFAASKGELPAPKVQKGGQRKRKDGAEFYMKDKLVFTPILKVISRNCKGMEIPYTLDYTFTQYENTGETLIPIGSGKTRRDQTYEFLVNAGWNEQTEDIPFSDNVLPFLQELLKKKAVKLQAEIKSGWIDSLTVFEPDLL